MIAVINPFCLAVAFGLSLFNFCTRLSVVGESFLRLLLIIEISFLGLFFLSLGSSWEESLFLFCKVISGPVILMALYSLGEKAKERGHPLRSLSFANWILQGIFLVSLISLIPMVLGGVYDFKRDMLLFLLTSAVFGSVLYAMLLGHWYLVVPKLSEIFLLRVEKIYFLLFALQLLLMIGTGLPISWNESDLFGKVILSMYLLWGCFGTLLCMFVAFKLTKMRSIQSATGLLYVAVFSALVGELMTLYFMGKR